MVCIPHPNNHKTQYPKYMSCYRSNFDQTLKVIVKGFCDYPKKMTTVMLPFLQAAFVLLTMENLFEANPTYPP